MKIHVTSILLIAISVLFVACGLTDSSNHEVANTTDSLILSLEIGKEVYQLGEPIQASLSITNISNFDVVVKRRMAVNTWSEVVTRRDVVFIIKDLTGQISSYSSRSHIDPVEEGDFILLQAGDKVEQKYNLDSLYNIDKYGTYSVFAIYQNSSDPKNATAWRGELVSNVILFTISP
jgi:hypothetical protein